MAHRLYSNSNAFQACAQHHLDSVNVSVKPGYAVSVVLASHGYPGSYSKGKRIEFTQAPSGAFHAFIAGDVS